MAFCKNCGKELMKDEKFCTSCGTSVSTNDSNQRKTKYEGELHKCPNCGEVLNSFVTKCSSCGHEIRGKASSEVIQEFARKLSQITIESQKVTLLRSFPIPNTKEDIFEFMILASTNVIGEKNKDLFNAWIAKFEQCYEKAKLSFTDEIDFDRIQAIYNKTNAQIGKERTSYNVNKMGSAVSRFVSTFPSPIFGIVVVLLAIYEVVRIAKGDFAGIDIIFVILILSCTYKITNKNNKK